MSFHCEQPHEKNRWGTGKGTLGVGAEPDVVAVSVLASKPTGNATVNATTVFRAKINRKDN